MSLDFLENDYQDDSDKYYSSNFESDAPDKSLDDIKIKENEGDNSPDNNNLYNPKSTKRSLSKKVLSVVKKNKTIAIAGGGVGGGVLVLIILIFILAQQLPGFASLLAAQSMARSNRAYIRDTTELTSENLALTAEQPVEQAITDAAFSSDAITGSLLSKLRSYTPTVYLNNLKESGAIKINSGPYEKGLGKFLGAEKPVSITITNSEGANTYAISDIAPSNWAKVSHPLATFGNRASAISDMNSNLALVNQDGSVLLRFGGMRQLITSVGGNLFGLISSKFVGKSTQAASEELNVEAESYINPPGSETLPLSSELSQAVSEGDSLSTSELNLSTPIGQAAQADILASGGVSTAVDTTVNSAIQSGINKSRGLLGAVSLPYLIGVPACIIYDGSLQTHSASKTINKQQSEVMKSYLLVESTASQEKSGLLSAEGVRAINIKLGNTINSNVDLASLGRAVNTNSSIMSPQSAVNGQYSSILSAIFPPAVSSWLDPVASATCSTVTNPYVAVGFTVAQVALYVAGLFTTGGIADVSTAGGEAAIQAGVEGGISASADGVGASVGASVEGVVGSSIATQANTQTFGSILKSESAKLFQYVKGDAVSGNSLKKTVGQLAAIGVGTWGLTQYAKAVVMQDMGTTYDGYSQGTDFANQAAAGGNALGNSTMQTQYFGTPLSASDVAYNNNATLAYLAQQNSIKSSYQRYLALSNPYSLLSKLYMNTYADITNFSLSSLLEKVASVFNPAKIISGLFTLFDNKTYATPNTSPSPPDNSDYGIVQWGYTQQEDALINPAINASASYQPLENAKILNSQKVTLPDGTTEPASQYIKDTYNVCFTSDMGTLLTATPKTRPDPGDTYIVRNKNGNVDPTKGLCSQQYLGPNSQDPNLSSNKDLVFRWRLNQSYNTSLTLLLGVQNANN
jgi:hypothetical protein